MPTVKVMAKSIQAITQGKKPKSFWGFVSHFVALFRPILTLACTCCRCEDNTCPTIDVNALNVSEGREAGTVGKVITFVDNVGES